MTDAPVSHRPPNQLGVHALVWTGSWDAASAQAACAATAAAGYDLIEIPLLDPTEVDPAMTRAALESAGLGATCSLGLAPDTDISSADGTVVARGEKLLHAALEVSAAIGSRYLGGVTYSAMTKYVVPPTPAGRANSVSVLRGLAQEARSRGVTIGLEAVNRYESNLLNTIDQALEHIDAIGEENVVVHVDTYHANVEEHDLPGAVRRAAGAGRLGYVHAGESHRGYLGTGSIAWDPFFDTLVEVRYGGPVVFESFSSVVVSERFAGALAIWRNLWSDSGDLATHAHAFIADHLSRRHQEAS